jgi:hypothetical protein
LQDVFPVDYGKVLAVPYDAGLLREMNFPEFSAANG